MKKTSIVANWKSNMTKNEAKIWLEEISKLDFSNDLEVIILAPFTLLDFVSSFVSQRGVSIKVGAQNISAFSQGPYTGEINGKQIKEFCDFVLIGHYERRKEFGEERNVVKQKVEQSIVSSLIPIVCISNFEEARDLEFAHSAVFSFEPPSAISTLGGQPSDVLEVTNFSQKFSSTFDNKLIYGGSIDSTNVKQYLNIPGISGVLVGAASLSSSTFGEILKNAV